MLFPHSLGIFYTAVTQWLGFPKYGDEGKVMGLAPYGDPERFLPKMRELVKLDGDSFELELDFFVHHKEGVDMTWDEQTPTIGRLFSDRMEQAFGPAREPRSELTKDHEDVAAALQAMLEEAYLHLVRAAHRRTGSKNLCLAGGVALNAVANGRIRPETEFEGVYVQPAAGDSGIAVGAAYYVWNQELGKPRGVRDGARVHRPAVHRRRGARPRSAPRASSPSGMDDAQLFDHVAERIADGDVVGWFQGRMEFGPRALGNRSIVVDPRRHDMKDILNARIKHREHFRPFAPSILAETTGDWFEQDYTSPFMVLVYKTRAGQARRDPGGEPRRRHGPAADGRGARRAAVLRADQGVRGPDRRPDRAQHVVQRERADRDDAGARGRDLREDEDGPARARKPRRPAWLTSRSASLGPTSASRRRARSRRCSRAAS